MVRRLLLMATLGSAGAFLILALNGGAIPQADTLVPDAVTEGFQQGYYGSEYVAPSPVIADTAEQAWCSRFRQAWAIDDVPGMKKLVPEGKLLSDPTLAERAHDTLAKENPGFTQAERRDSVATWCNLKHDR